jgi:hypothetical protein
MLCLSHSAALRPAGAPPAGGGGGSSSSSSSSTGRQHGSITSAVTAVAAAATVLAAVLLRRASAWLHIVATAKQAGAMAKQAGDAGSSQVNRLAAADWLTGWLPGI